MKHINQFITEYIIKKKLDKPINSEYKYHPQTKEELIENIKELLDKEETDFNCIDTSEITDMSNLFSDSYIDGNTEIIIIKDMNINISNWDVSNVTNMYTMFEGCSKFKGKGLENWDVSKVESISYMFFDCINFDCDLSNWDVSNVKDMKGMFYNCNLKNTPKWYKE